MYQNNIWFFFFQNFLHFCKNLRGYIKQTLLFLHDIQIPVRHDVKCLQYLFQHFFVLARYTYHTLYLRPFSQLQNHRTHFYSFRTRSKNDHYFFLHITYLLLQSRLKTYHLHPVCTDQHSRSLHFHNVSLTLRPLLHCPSTFPS